MENAEVKQEQVIVKKGLIYYIIKLISTIIKGIFISIKFLLGLVKKSLDNLNFLIQYSAKTKRLKNKLYKRLPDEELV